MDLTFSGLEAGSRADQGEQKKIYWQKREDVSTKEDWSNEPSGRGGTG